MPSLKDLRARIGSVKNTQKITSAMKMVSAAKLRRAQEAAEAARPYAQRLQRVLSDLAQAVQGQAGAPKLLAGTGSNKVHLIVVVSADRGLCGGFNGHIVRSTRGLIKQLQGEGKTIKVLYVGRKARDPLKRDYADLTVHAYEGMMRRGATFAAADEVASKVLGMYENGEFDVATVIYNKFKSAIVQIVTRHQLIPFPVRAGWEDEAKDSHEAKAAYEYEPSEEGILAELLPKNVTNEVFTALLESDASEQGARMAAMDNATRNAGDMIKKLTTKYNRSRQAMITKELIEIISGAEAV